MPFSSRILQGLVGLGLLLGAHASAFESSRWFADYEEIKSAMAAAYANLDTQVRARKLDLAALDRDTQAALGRAESDREAIRAIDSLLKAFGDGHLRLLPRAATPTATGGEGAAAPARRTCADLGYRSPRRQGVNWASLDAYQPLGTADDVNFPAGILDLGAGRKIGVLRIALFGEDGYLPICEAILAGKASCDKACETDTWRAVGTEMSASLARQAREFERRGAMALVVDVSGNGGGSEWVENAARILAAPGLPSPRVGFVKHPHWARRFDRRIAEIDTDLTASGLPEPQIMALRSARAQLATVRMVAGAPCDRAGVWRGEAGCESVGTGELFTTGHLAARPTFDLNGLKSASALFSVRGDRAHDGAFRGRLAIVIDEKTASAAEQFAAMLKDGAGAVLMGEKTNGSGCGYTGGGIQTVLTHSQMRLRMPDCVRFRKDGSNEVLGIVPDVPVSSSRANTFVRAIEGWISK